MANKQFSDFLKPVVEIAERAGKAIMEIYQQDFSVYEKSDASPLTEADLAAHKLIVTALAELADFPILSEESAAISWQERQNWETYWLVDPLDGTKEFIKKNGEFTVNIALIHEGVPVLGVVYAPALDVTYSGALAAGASKTESNGKSVALKPTTYTTEELIKVVGSRSHQSPEIKDFLTSLQGKSELVAMGSSLKLCLIAEGAAHLYPRLGPTSEWDTAAAHAVVKAAGGKVTVMQKNAANIWEDSQNELLYNQKESILNPYFLVSA